MTVSDKRKAYLRDYQRQWVARRRAEFFAGKACVRCGSQERLELDHIDPKLKVAHQIWSWSEVRQAEEIAKCQVLCHDCHLQKTGEDFGWGTRPHGTLTSYKRYGCRCAECRAANATWARESRLRKKREYRARKKIETP